MKFGKLQGQNHVSEGALGELKSRSLFMRNLKTLKAERLSKLVAQNKRNTKAIIVHSRPKQLIPLKLCLPLSCLSIFPGAFHFIFGLGEPLLETRNEPGIILSRILNFFRWNIYYSTLCS